MTRRFAGIYAILDTQIIRDRDPAALAAAAARGGATTLQLRAKDLSTRDFVSLAERVMSGLVGSRVPLLINDRIDVALAVGAAGVHIGRDDMQPTIARRLLGADKIIGVTIKSADDLAVLAPVADYGCIGGVFATRHKLNPDAPVGLDGFVALYQSARARFLSLPVGAIAGITVDNVAAVSAAGADFAAVVGAVFDATDVEGATRTLLRAFAAGKVR
jgi:thiamine-phosphate pyrophosphorylase